MLLTTKPFHNLTAKSDTSVFNFFTLDVLKRNIHFKLNFSSLVLKKGMNSPGNSTGHRLNIISKYTISTKCDMKRGIAGYCCKLNEGLHLFFCHLECSPSKLQGSTGCLQQFFDFTVVFLRHTYSVCISNTGNIGAELSYNNVGMFMSSDAGNNWRKVRQHQDLPHFTHHNNNIHHCYSQLLLF